MIGSFLNKQILKYKIDRFNKKQLNSSDNLKKCSKIVEFPKIDLIKENHFYYSELKNQIMIK